MADSLYYRILLVPLCSVVFYIFLFKLYKYLFQKTERPESSQLREEGRYFRYDLLAAGIMYLFFTLLYFYPCLRAINTHLIGPAEDNMKHFWNMWWMQKAVTEPSISLSFSNYICYPQGSSLLYYSYSFFNIYLSVLLRPLINNPVTVYNLLILQTFPLSGIGAFLLARYLTRNSYVALIAGFIFAFNPSHFVHALHHAELSSIQFIPFFLLFFIRTIRGNSKRDLFLASLFFFLNSISAWYYLILPLCFILFSYTYLMIRRKEFFLKDILLKAAIVVGPTLLILSPWIARMILLGLQKTILLQVRLEKWGYRANVADTFAFFLPHSYHWLGDLKMLKDINSRIIGRLWEEIVYLGIVNVSIILLTFKGIIRKSAKYFLGLFTFLILSLGPSLHVLEWATPIRLPFAIVKFIPFLSHAWNASRVIVYAYLFLSVIVAFALKYIADSYKPRMRRNCLLVMLVFLIFLDYYSTCSSMTKAYLPPCYNVIKKEEEVFGILDLPGRDIATVRYMMYQTFHGFPIVRGAIPRKANRTLVDRLRKKDLLKQKKQLIANKVKYIVIHKYWLWVSHKRKDEIIKRYARYYKQIYEDKESALFQVY